MTLYNVIQDNGLNGSTLSSTTDPGPYVMALAFTVSSNCWINGVWWYCNLSGGQFTNSTATEKIGLYLVGTGVVPGSVTPAGTYTVQGFNLLNFATPVALTSGQEYVALKGIDGSTNTYCYNVQHDLFAGGVGGNGFPDGPALVYSTYPSGISNQNPAHVEQQSFDNTTLNVASVSYPSAFAGFEDTWYGMDIQIDTVGPPSAVAAAAVALGDQSRSSWVKLRILGVM